MNITVIIPSFNGEHKLPRILELISAQTIMPGEVIVVVDGSTDGSKTVLDTLNQKYNNLRILEQKNSGRSSAKNSGARIANGEILVFLDDDMLPESQLLEKHLQYHKSHKNCICVGSGYRNPDEATDNFRKYLIKTEESWKKLKPVKFRVTKEDFTFTSCNMSVSKSIFWELNGFDECLFDCEDFDLGIRALGKSVPVYYDRSILAWHNDWPDIYAYIHRHCQYKEGEKKLLIIHPEYRNLFPASEYSEPGMLKKTVSSFLRYTLFSLFSPGKITNILLPAFICNTYYRLFVSCHSYSRS